MNKNEVRCVRCPIDGFDCYYDDNAVDGGRVWTKIYSGDTSQCKNCKLCPNKARVK